MSALTRRNSKVPKSPVLQFADLSLDTLTRLARRGSKPIVLTAKEYAVLECLFRETERVLTRTQIAEHVWNYDVYNQFNVVDVYIRNRRRKTRNCPGIWELPNPPAAHSTPSPTLPLKPRFLKA